MNRRLATLLILALAALGIIYEAVTKGRISLPSKRFMIWFVALVILSLIWTRVIMKS